MSCYQSPPPPRFHGFRISGFSRGRSRVRLSARFSTRSTMAPTTCRNYDEMNTTPFPGASARLRQILLLLLGLAALSGPFALGQPSGPIITIPIEKVREHYNNPAEDGTGKNCGVRLYGEWPAYRNYTNRTSYRIFTPGLQSIPTPQSSVLPGGRFRFYCYFNGISSPVQRLNLPGQDRRTAPGLVCGGSTTWAQGGVQEHRGRPRAAGALELRFPFHRPRR